MISSFRNFSHFLMTDNNLKIDKKDINNFVIFTTHLLLCTEREKNGPANMFLSDYMGWYLPRTTEK